MAPPQLCVSVTAVTRFMGRCFVQNILISLSIGGYHAGQDAESFTSHGDMARDSCNAMEVELPHVLVSTHYCALIYKYSIV
jgi:hypothetical protein